MDLDNVVVYENERLDDLHRKNYQIIQDPKRFCFGIDAVLLSEFAKVKNNEKVIDLGTGTGIIPILLEARYGGENYFAIDIQKESVEMANRSVELNLLQDKIKVVNADIKNLFDKENEVCFQKSYFDVVVSNPPYMNNGGGIRNEFDPKAIARHELLCNLEDVISSASKLLKFGGRFYMVHRPHRLVDIFLLLRKYKLEPKVVRFVQPYKDREPNMVLIESVRGGKAMLKVMTPLIVYKNSGEYTEEINQIYYE